MRHSRLRELSHLTSIAGVLLTIAAGTVQAAPCAGFTDVQSTSPFCANVEWIRNRGVTLGCSSTTLYCPDATVTRLQMAAFMNRLGTALTPVQLHVQSMIGAIDLDASPVVCQTGAIDVAGYPRRAYLDLSFFASAAADVGLAADLVMTADGGASWANLNAIANRGSVPANLWGGIADIANVDLNVGQTVRWGVRVTRGGIAGVADITDSGCQLRVLIYSRDGASSPL